MRPIGSIIRTFTAGLLTVLPIVVTVAIIGWVGSFLAALLGPNSAVGRGLAQLGALAGYDEWIAYALGSAIVLVALYFLGLVVQSRLQTNIAAMLDHVVTKIPLIGTIYAVTNRFVGLFERRDGVDLQSMSPVWCFFGDGQETAVLGLMPASEIVEIEGAPYRIVMVPTAPIPFGGALLFLPERWVKPAGFGVEGLTNIYVSMGVVAPDYLKRVPTLVTAPDAPPAAVRPASKDEPALPAPSDEPERPASRDEPARPTSKHQPARPAPSGKPATSRNTPARPGSKDQPARPASNDEPEPPAPADKPASSGPRGARRRRGPARRTPSRDGPG